MLFNSLVFAVFFIIVYTLYVILNHRWQNRLLLVASYVFYGWWDWRFLSLIFLSTTLDYYFGLKIHSAENQRKKKTFLFLSIFTNLSILGSFKYYDFFASSLQRLLNHFNITISPHLLHVILPVGISFYTFQAMSYTIDIYRKRTEPAKRFSDFALFVSYFPQLVAGPIERSEHLLPQVIAPRRITREKFFEGVHLIFWGLFLKIFVADNLARIVDPVFAGHPPYGGAVVIIALYAFAFQIYCDFDGYSTIARGLGYCMGFDIMLNFNLPYFSTNPREFWRRWHISLSTWLKDYLYIPLGGSKKGALKTYRNLAITMFLGGLWHGAAWTFVFWGIYHGILLIVHRMCEPFLKKVPSPRNATLRNSWFIVRAFFFFNIVCLGWLLFRARSVTQVIQMLRSLNPSFQHVPAGVIPAMAAKLLFFVWLLLLVQAIQFWKNNLLVVYRSNIIVRYAFYYVCLILMVVYGLATAQPFIYFQF